MPRWRVSLRLIVLAGHRRWSNQRKWVSIVSKWLPFGIQVSGLGALSVGAFVWSVPLGWVVSGFGLIVCGLGLERGNAE